MKERGDKTDKASEFKEVWLERIILTLIRVLLLNHYGICSVPRQVKEGVDFYQCTPSTFF